MLNKDMDCLNSLIKKESKLVFYNEKYLSQVYSDLNNLNKNGYIDIPKDINTEEDFLKWMIT